MFATLLKSGVRVLTGQPLVGGGRHNFFVRSPNFCQNLEPFHFPVGTFPSSRVRSLMSGGYKRLAP